MALTATIGKTGYLGFLDNTKSNILLNFPVDATLMRVARGFMAVTMILTIPLAFFVCHHVVFQLFFGGIVDQVSINLDGNEQPAKKWLGCLGRHQWVTLAILLLSLAPALALNDLGVVLSFSWAVGASSLAYTAPGLAYLGINGADFLQWATQFIRQPEKAEDVSEVTVSGIDKAVDVVLESDETKRDFSLPKGSKPCWWYLLGLPIWTRIAMIGASNVQRFCDDSLDAATKAEEKSIRIGSCCLSIFFIVFGFIAMIARVGSTVTTM